MEELLKKLMESELLDESTKDKIEKAMEAKLIEMRQDIESDVAEKHKADMKRLTLACEAMINDGIAKVTEDYASEISRMRKLNAKSAKAIAEAKNIAERDFEKKLKVLEAMVNENVDKHMVEFIDDQKNQRRAFVKMMNEAKKKASEDRALFVTRGAKVLEHIVDGMIGPKIQELAESIEDAKKAQFGRELFDAFATTFRLSFFNEHKELRELKNKLDETKKAKAKAERLLETKTSTLAKQLEEATNQRKKLDEKIQRNEIIDSLCRRLTGAKARGEMRKILESTSTGNLKKTFRNYLPIITESQKADLRAKPKKKALTETVHIRTGNRTEQITGEDLDPDLDRLSKMVSYGRS